MSATDKASGAAKRRPWGAISVIAMVVIFLALYAQSFKDHGQAKQEPQIAGDTRVEATPVATTGPQPDSAKDDATSDTQASDTSATGGSMTTESDPPASVAPPMIVAPSLENTEPVTSEAPAVTTPEMSIPAMPVPVMPAAAIPMPVISAPPMPMPVVTGAPSAAEQADAVDAGTSPATTDQQVSESSAPAQSESPALQAQTPREQAIEEVEARAFANALLGTENGTVKGEIWLAEPFLGENAVTIERMPPQGSAPIPVQQVPSAHGYLPPAAMTPPMRQPAWMDSTRGQWHPGQPIQRPMMPMGAPSYPLYRPYP